MTVDIWNWCTSCGRSIPAHQPFRTWCDTCVDELQVRLDRDARAYAERTRQVKQPEPGKP